MTKKRKLTDVIRFREDFRAGEVILEQNATNRGWVTVRRFDEYRTAAEYAQDRWNLSDAKLMEMYYEYKYWYDDQ